jgi:hypothetical protein
VCRLPEISDKRLQKAGNRNGQGLQGLCNKPLVGEIDAMRRGYTGRFIINKQNINMATKSIYDKCTRINREINLRDIHTGSRKPNLKKLFGVKKLVNKYEFERCSESEKRRHLYEDKVLRSLYIENETYGKFFVKSAHVVCMEQNLHSVRKIFALL